MKVWASRFKKEPEQKFISYTSSRETDASIIQEDIKGSIAHVEMLLERRIVPKKAAQKIKRYLKELLKKAKQGKLVLPAEAEDVHTFIEEKLLSALGEEGGWLHTGRSRNDQIAVDEVLWVRRRLTELKRLVIKFQKTLVKRAEQEIDTPLIFYTHLQPAFVGSAAAWFMATFFYMENLIERINHTLQSLASPLGATAGGGTSLGIDRKQTAQRLKLNRVNPSSLLSVAARDHFFEVLYICSLLMLHLSRICEDLVVWANPQIGFIKLSEKWATGSSILPHKVNPDLPEIIRGKSSRVLGALNSLFILLKGLPLSYNRDLQVDREIVFPAVEETLKAVCIFSDFIEKGFKFVREKIQSTIEENEDLLSQDFVEYLVKKGVPTRKAHRIIGQLITYAEEKGMRVRCVPFEFLKKLSPRFDKDFYEIFKVERLIDSKCSFGGVGRPAVREQIKLAKKFMEGKDEE